MAMTPEEKKEFEELKRIVRNLQGVTDIPFIESAKRNIVNTRLADLGLDEVVSKTGTGNTSGVLTGVSESGTSSYNVARAYNGTITVRDAQGNLYKLGYYSI